MLACKCEKDAVENERKIRVSSVGLGCGRAREFDATEVASRLVVISFRTSTPTEALIDSDTVLRFDDVRKV